MKVQLLKNYLVRRVFGKVEIDTIIKKLEGKKLKQTEKNYLYRSIRPKLIAASLIEESGILKEISKKKKNENSIIEYNLSLYGYPMFLLKEKKGKKISIEELIAKILLKHSNARYIEAIPVIIVKNKIDKLKILEIAFKHGLKNKIGYLIETAILIRPLPYLKEVLSYLKKNKDEEVSFLVEGEYEFLSKTSPSRIKNWNLLGRFFDEDFISNARLYL
ncbi:MAG: hypothetical protein AABX33_03460 [Nanoarchaeota archaeon]